MGGSRETAEERTGGEGRARGVEKRVRGRERERERADNRGMERRARRTATKRRNRGVRERRDGCCSR